MENIRSIQDAKNKMQKSVNYYKTRINAWENVTRKYKKDGSDFKNINQCFSGAEIVNEYGSNRIRVNFHTNESGYEYDDIYLDGDCYGREPADTADKIQERIEKVIANYKKWLAKDEKGLAEIEKQIESLNTYIEKINEIVKTAENETNTHYALRAYLKSALNII